MSIPPHGSPRRARKSVTRNRRKSGAAQVVLGGAVSGSSPRTTKHQGEEDDLLRKCDGCMEPRLACLWHRRPAALRPSFPL